MIYTTDNERIYTMENMHDYLSCISDYETITKQKRGRGEKCKYINLPCAFDIEAYSWYEEQKKKACMYIWQLGICGHCIIGRTWKEFKKIIKELKKHFNLSKDNKLIIYVHHLGYEYQFIKNLFKFIEVFELDDRKPVKATTADGIEFRCSYILSGKGLEKTADSLLKYKVKKAVGQLDYSKARNSKTPLTESEMEYCINDIKVVMSYIQEKIEQDGDITKIPLTNTGYVRKYCRDKCFGKGKSRVVYNQFIKRLELTEFVYEMLKDAFQGGYVHCNAYYSLKKLYKVDSYDFISSYIASMLAHKLPMASPVDRGQVSIEEYESYIYKKCCLSKMKFINIRLKEDMYMAPISESKCEGKLGYIDNGRVYDAKELTTTITEQDYFTYKEFYDWDSVIVERLITFDNGYLPTCLVEAILDLYEKKTKYKGVDAMKVEYQLSKSMANGIYGMCVTDVMKEYDSMEDYNKSFNRFLYYPWGVWIAAISRRALFTGIKECGEDIVYCDTDSLKMVNAEAHREYINKYNKWITEKLDKAMDFHGIDRSRTRPKDINGIERQLGIWDYEGQYEEFKGIRAKAYIAKKEGKYELTLSGVEKEAGLKYLKSIGDPIDALTSHTVFPAGSCGKLTHTYVDEGISGTLVDYLGNAAKYEEKSYIHMKEASYDMRLESEFLDFINFVKNGIIKK